MDHVKKFADDVCEHLATRILKAFDEHQQPLLSPIMAEVLSHLAFAQERTASFSGRSEIVSHIS